MRAAVCCLVALLGLGSAAAVAARPADDLSPVPALADSASLAAFLALPEADRAARREQARVWTSRWEQFASDERHYERWVDRQAGGAEAQDPRSLSGSMRGWLGSGAVAAVGWLRRALALDPGDGDAWLALVRLSTALGDAAMVRSTLAGAARAADALPHAALNRRHEIALVVARGRGWLCRDAGRWDEGLAAVGAGLALEPGDLELTLVKGLLLAGAGRSSAADAVARELPAIEYRVFNLYQAGMTRARSDFGSRWIQAMVCLAAGEIPLAAHALGELHPARRRVPFVEHFWNDVGLISELNDRPDDAATQYALALISSPYHEFRPWSGFSIPPRILGQPDVRLPVYVCGGRLYLSGSLLAYGAQIAGEAEEAADPAAAAREAALADSALTACLRRHIRPVLARALRGELRAVQHEDSLAEVDLARARDELAALGQRNARTSLMLGILRLNRQRRDEAIDLLREAVGADSTLAMAWRTLGVALAEVGQPAVARAAMDRAIALEPEAAIGWFNRGLLNLAQQVWGPAAADLREAASRDPTDERILRALARAQQRVPDTVSTTIPATRPVYELRRVAAAPARLELRVADAAVGQARAARAEPDTIDARTVRDLEQAWRHEPTPARRLHLASAYARLGRDANVLQLLAPHWGGDLSPVEMRLVLATDRLSGDSARARALARDVDPERPQPADRELWALVAVTCGGASHPQEALRALDAALKLDPRNVGLLQYRRVLQAQIDAGPPSPIDVGAVRGKSPR